MSPPATYIDSICKLLSSFYFSLALLITHS